MDTVAVKKLLEGLDVTEQEAKELYDVVTTFAIKAIDAIFEEAINGANKQESIKRNK